MGQFIEGEERGQLSLMPTSLDEFVEEDNPVRAVDAFMDDPLHSSSIAIGYQPAVRKCAISQSIASD